MEQQNANTNYLTDGGPSAYTPAADHRGDHNSAEDKMAALTEMFQSFQVKVQEALSGITVQVNDLKEKQQHPTTTMPQPSTDGRGFAMSTRMRYG